MRKIDDIREIHQILIEIARVFHEICNKDNLPYYMIYGTMLGARRHKGFIPWDDDMDFAIDYRYYDRLVKILKKNLPSPYKLITRYDKGGAVGGYLKIINCETIIREDNKLYEDENTGLFVDVFLLYNASNSLLSLRNAVIKGLLVVQHFRFFKFHEMKWSKNLFEKIVKTVFGKLERHQIVDFIEKHLIANRAVCFSTYASIYGRKDIIPQQYYGKPKLYKFEDIELYGVEDADAYLRQLYGDYMKLPPEDKRKVHMQEVYILND